MKRIFVLSIYLWMTALWADVTDVTYSTSHTIASVILDPVNFCYPPNLPTPVPFSQYFANDRCYYRFNNDCAQAQVLTFDHSNTPDQQQNAKFFQLCNSTDSTTAQMGPEFLFYVNAQEVLTACMILATNLNAENPNQTTLSVLNQAPGSTTHAPGCNINEITVWNLQKRAPPGPSSGLLLTPVECLSITGGTRDSVAPIKDINAALTNNYVECPAAHLHS